MGGCWVRSHDLPLPPREPHEPACRAKPKSPCCSGSLRPSSFTGWAATGRWRSRRSSRIARRFDRSSIPFARGCVPRTRSSRSSSIRPRRLRRKRPSRPRTRPTTPRTTRSRIRTPSRSRRSRPRSSRRRRKRRPNRRSSRRRSILPRRSPRWSRRLRRPWCRRRRRPAAAASASGGRREAGAAEADRAGSSHRRSSARRSEPEGQPDGEPHRGSGEHREGRDGRAAAITRSGSRRTRTPAR